jgi:hypothetical protein
MKKYLIVITMMLALGLNTQAASQKHRHSSRTEQVDSTKNNQDAIEAFSDTTSTADAEDAEDDKYITHRHRSVVYGGNDDFKEVMDDLGGILAPSLVFSLIAMVIMFILAPLLIIIAIFYFVNKNRRERYKLAQMAIQNGQPIPDDILKGQTRYESKGSDYQTGMRQMFTGIGLAIFLGLVIGKWGVGIGALVFFIGLGKWYIARQSGDTGNNPLNNNNSNNQFNNNSNVSDL